MTFGSVARVRSSALATAPPRWFRISVLVIVATVAVVQLVWVVQRAMFQPGGDGMRGDDFDLYMDATRRWLGGGGFYVDSQIAGPYTLTWGAILYPPPALILFVPFVWLGGVLWVLIPTLIIGAIVWSHRPRMIAWLAILAILIAWPLTILIWVAGNPTLWVIAIIAMATRWPWVSAFMWIKPSVIPFALLGARDRRWWVVSVAMLAVSLAALPMTIDWLRVVINARGADSGIWYSLSPGSLAPLAVPLIARAGRRAGPPHWARSVEPGPMSRARPPVSPRTSVSGYALGRNRDQVG